MVGGAFLGRKDWARLICVVEPTRKGSPVWGYLDRPVALHQGNVEPSSSTGDRVPEYVVQSLQD